MSEFENATIGAAPTWRAAPEGLSRPRATFVTGIADGSIVILYMAGIAAERLGYVMGWYAATLVLKLVMVWLLWRNAGPLSLQSKLLLASATAMNLTTILAGVAAPTAYSAAAAFLAHLATTLLIVGRAGLRNYLRGLTVVITISAVFHAALCLQHRMNIAWGRYTYFAGMQPNLGGEIDAVGAMAAVLAFPRRSALVIAAAMTVDAMLLQARSAIIVSLTMMALAVLIDPRRVITLRSGIAMALAAAVTLSALVGIGLATRGAAALSNILLLNDQYRGFASGASGRTDIWQQAVDLFTSSPLYGHSLDYFNRIGFIGAHNLVLHGLAQYGIMSIPFFASLIYAFYRVFTVDKFRFVVITLALPLFLFNDRFINLNPYPFMIYVILCADA